MFVAALLLLGLIGFDDWPEFGVPEPLAEHSLYGCSAA